MKFHISHIKDCEREFGSDKNLTKQQQISSWAKQMVLKYVGLPLEIVYKSNGKPFFKNNNTIKLSISHTYDYVAVAISNREIGIDIEHLRQNKQEIAKRFFTNEENNFLSSVNTDSYDFYFTKLWTLKEAYSKCIGAGISGTFSQITIDVSTLSVKNDKRDIELTSIFDSETELFISTCEI
ncbi:MAG: 4'-phosphopantetheinyl transferase superfamily protein [Bacteroidales bacterium]|jgi:4'-phosphopantetheinyl transferase|nr:4'-phosphopantetheinyl transferase superfamily protein [Bacteroidales bacterium]